ncbi:MAG TPA: aldehyde dehydrogenase family protein [Coriobacteriia bacterium]|nr:aldehyde dehydrogenase family protein [Coriobacteriia bacterium]
MSPVAESDIASIAESLRASFPESRHRTDVGFRVDGLKRLRAAVIANHQRLVDALAADLGKPELEAVGSDIMPLINELDELIAHTRRWSRPRRVGTPLLTPGTSRIVPEPFGVVLVISPWNYPLQLALVPAIGAIAAGNSVVIKPSQAAPATSAMIAELIESSFAPDHVVVVGGGPGHSEALTAQKWDYIFFTGGTETGRLIMRAAAETLTPVTLELGGKNPCVVSEHADIVAAARRIAWGKFFNAGQTCIAPDHAIVHASVKEQFIAELAKQARAFYGDDPACSACFARIIDDRHHARLLRLIEGENVVFGGKSDASQRYLAPTIVDDASWDRPLMGEEIFGPVLPIFTYSDFDELMREIECRPKPLSAYIFSRDRAECARMQLVPAGAVLINDTLLHFTNPHLPFGGVGESGMGAYHGKRTFTTFSHAKAVLQHRGFPRLLGVRWPPYRLPMWLIRISLRWFG